MCLMQNLKAVAMGIVTATTICWPNKPNPATVVPTRGYGGKNVCQWRYFFKPGPWGAGFHTGIRFPRLKKLPYHTCTYIPILELFRSRRFC